MYGNNPYMTAYNPQMNIDRINNQIAELEKMKAQIPQQIQQPQQPTNLTQNFQLAPNNRDVIRYAGSIDEVQRDTVMGDTPYFSRDLSVVWIKSAKGDIKTYELVEIIPKDEKDMQIDLLMTQIEELKGMIQNERSTTNDDTTKVSTNTAGDDTPVRKSTKKNKT